MPTILLAIFSTFDSVQVWISVAYWTCTVSVMCTNKMFGCFQKLIQDGCSVFLTCRCFRSRRRRSSDIVFSPNMVHILPGYPKQSPKDPKNAMLAFYLSLPPEISQGSVVSKEILTSLIKSNMTSIGRSMNLSIVSVDALSSPSAAFQSNDDSSNKSEGNRTVIVGGSVGGSLFVVLIAVLLVVYKKNRR